MELVTIDQVRAHCRAEPEDDTLLTLYAEAAEAQAQDFINRRVFKDIEALALAVLEDRAGDDPIVVTAAIKAAVLLTTGHLYRNREEVITGTIVSEMKEGARALLWPYRVGLGV